MRLDGLRVENCRNIRAAELVFDPGLTVITGANGQGKTSLLECVFMLTGSKSFRGARDMDLVRRGEAMGKVCGSADTGGRESEITIRIEGPGGGRRGRFASINGVDYGRAGAIAGIFTAVVFEPNHLSLVKAGPEGRRKFLDAALCQLYPGYLSILRRYTRALSQKNALLKNYHEFYDAAGQLVAFDAELAFSGEEITKRRMEWMQLAAPAAARYYDELTNGAEQLEVNYSPSAQAGQLDQKLAAARGADIRAGFSTAGPHREDFETLVNGTSARIYGSQGQQRSAVLSLKLAEAECARQVTGQQPVLLLDDVLSELDETRQGYLLGHMGTGQSIVTCCDAGVFEKTAGRVVSIIDGQIGNE